MEIEQVRLGYSDAGKELVSFIKDEVYLKTIGASTGLIDKNKKLIFEGDIIKDGSISFEVYYDEFYGFRKVPLGHSKEYQSGLQTHKYCEIIGNIHEANND